MIEVEKAVQDSTSIANTHQEGGSHYIEGAGHCPVCGTPLEHWDVVAMFGLDYFTGAATKYLFRLGRKGDTKEQLRKAIHYLQKRLELEERHGSA